MRHITTLGCACNAAGNSAMVEDILAGMESAGRGMKKRRGKKKALAELLSGKKATLEGLPSSGSSVVGVLPEGKAGAAVFLAVILGSAAGLGALAGLGVAKLVSNGKEPEYAKGAVIGAGGGIAMLFLGTAT